MGTNDTRCLLCAECGTVAPDTAFLLLQRQEDTSDLAVAPQGSTAALVLCPSCRHIHADEDAGAGLFRGTRGEMEGVRLGLLAESKIWLEQWDNAWPKPSRDQELWREVLAAAAGELEAIIRDTSRAASRRGTVEDLTQRLTAIATKMRVQARFEVDPVTGASPTTHADQDETVPTRGEQEEEVTGWFFPSAAKKAHFDGGDGRSLCGKWGRTGFGGSAEIQGDASSPPTDVDCVACRRKLEASTQSKTR